MKELEPVIPQTAELDAYNTLSRIYLAGVEADEAAALTLMVERARLLVYGPLAIIAGALTAAWTSQRAVCVAPTKLGVLLLASAVGCAWVALQSAETHYWGRMSRKYAALAEAASALPTGERDAQTTASLQAARRDEVRASDALRGWSTAAYSLAFFGAVYILSGAMAGIGAASCWYFLWSPLRWLN